MRGIQISQSITSREDASLKTYFKEVSKLPRINHEEEIELSEKIKQGDKRALDKLVTANLRFAISVAKQYQGKGLPLVDLIQAANEGLIKAASTFDGNKGFKFISYAVWWIRQSVTKALSDYCRTVRIPLNQITCSGKLSKVIDRFEQDNGRKPNSIELEEITDINVDKINDALSSYNKSVSLETPIKDSDSGCLLDIIPNEDSKDDSLDREDLRNSIERVLSKLSYRDRDILRMSYGIGMQPMSHTKIGELFGLGSERIRQLQHEAIKKIQRFHLNEFEV